MDNLTLFTRKGKENEPLNKYKKYEDNLTSLEGIHLLSLLYLANKEVENTIEVVKRGLEIFPHNKKLHSLLGNVYLMKGDLHNARKEYEQGENRIDGFFEIANRYKEIGKIKEAIDVYHKIIQIEPKHLNSYISLGGISEQIGNYKEAIQAYERATELDLKNVNIYWKLASLYYKQGMIDKVILLCEKIIKLAPENIEAYKNLGLLYYQKGEFKKAELQFNKILTFAPEDSAVKQMLEKIKKKVDKDRMIENG